MSILHVRNFPENLYEQIRRLAEQENRSISAQVIYLLERAVVQNPQAQQDILGNIRRRRTFNPEQVGAPGSLSLLHEDRAR